jgi:hypothetical protein
MAGSDGDTQRIAELEGRLRTLVAQARDVVQEIGEIKAEMRHISAMGDGDGAGPGLLGSAAAPWAGTHGSGWNTGEERVSVPRWTAGQSSSAAAARSARRHAAADASSTPGKWPMFSQDTIQRYEAGLDSRGSRRRSRDAPPSTSMSRQPHAQVAHRPVAGRRRAPAAAGSQSRPAGAGSGSGDVAAGAGGRGWRPPAAPPPAFPQRTGYAAGAVGGVHGAAKALPHLNGETPRQQPARAGGYMCVARAPQWGAVHVIAGVVGLPLGWGPRIRAGASVARAF